MEKKVETAKKTKAIQPKTIGEMKNGNVKNARRCNERDNDTKSETEEEIERLRTENENLRKDRKAADNKTKEMEQLLEEEKSKNESLRQQLETEKKNSEEMKKSIAEKNEILEKNIAEKNEILEKYNILTQRDIEFNHAKQPHSAQTEEKINQRKKERVNKSHFDIMNKLGEGSK